MNPTDNSRYTGDLRRFADAAEMIFSHPLARPVPAPVGERRILRGVSGLGRDAAGKPYDRLSVARFPVGDTAWAVVASNGAAWVSYELGRWSMGDDPLLVDSSDSTGDWSSSTTADIVDALEGATFNVPVAA